MPRGVDTILRDETKKEVRRVKSIRTRLIIAFLMATVLMAVVIGGYNIYSQMTNSEKNLQAYRDTLFAEYDRGIKTDVEIAISLIDKVYKEQQAFLLTEEEAKAKAADLVRELRFEGENYFWIDTTEGVNVVLLGRDTEGKSRIEAKDPNGFAYVKDGFIKNGILEGGGYSDYEFAKPNETEPTPKRGYTLVFKPYGWVVGTGNWVDDINIKVTERELVYQEQLTKDITKTGVVMIIGLLIVVVFAFWMSQKIAKQIQRVALGAKEIAQGNLKIDKIAVGSQDELGQLAQDFNSMTENLTDLVKQISQAAEHVASSSQQLSAGAEQSAQASNEVAAAITEVAQGTENQMNAVNQVAAVVEEMAAGMDQVLTNTEYVVRSAEGTAQAAKKGQESIHTTIDQMDHIQKAVNNSASLVEQLGVRSQEIGQIVETIAAIADQTNLLSLNAAIEAARAGEQGRGFSVVAEEVRKLAEQSQTAAKQIADLIGGIQSDTDKAVEAMKYGTQEVETGAKVVTQAGSAFEEIAQLIQEVTEKVRGMSQEIAHISQGSEQIVSSVREVDQISKSIAEQTQNVSASTEEQSASVEEIASSSQVLARMSEEMEQALRKFKL
ncbi:methyl-accepting chemotaxis protein [Desulfitobacterium dichloroeliminans LMG P-21439]|uniref:Methyl-accepting chemotaxis protein n=1 Tax=Desulfitobacterium dichloroeliminans (strain LMG P-21439 / DCA1) TaxID=871963 RepID=L0F370_DESDL|nr:methyl-accepting chemotaxis protein [Desulfitobacterium dichloroeliminans LMG P-21439]